MTRASLTRRLRKLEAGARASQGFGVFSWAAGRWAADTPGASLPGAAPSLPAVLEACGEGDSEGPALLFAGDSAPVRVIVGISGADL